MSIEEQVECPLCMEPLELDDLNFFPCTCGYQICRFCWHRIRTDENGLCPACRKAYPEDPAEFKPLTEDEFSCHRLQRIKRERKVKDLQRKQKAAENRKHLANVRVVQKNLVFVVGLSQRLGDTEVLKKHDYFGKFGKIVKVVINQSTSYAGSQVGGPSASAYITYQKPEDALRAIQAVNNIHVDGRTLKASLGTTKYCSHFLRGTQCPKGDCMYLHELGDEAASFTKDEMQQGKHQEYEQKLYETYMNHLNSVNLATNQSTTQTAKHSQTTRKKSSSPASSQRQTPPLSASQNTSTQQHTTHDAWPSLNTGPGGRPTDRQNSTDPTTTTNTSSSSNTGQEPPPQTHTRTGSQDLQNRHTPDSQRPSPQLDTSSTSSSMSSSSNSTQPQSTSSTSSSLHRSPQHSPPSSTTTQPLLGGSTAAGTQSITPQTTTTGVMGGAPTSSTSSQIHTQLNNRQSNPTHNHIHTQGPTTRKPLYGDTNTDNMSLFSSSGFPVTRNPSKPPVSLLSSSATTSHHTDNTGIATATSSYNTNLPITQTSAAASAMNHSHLHDTLPSSHEIPDTISVTSSTDWQAAFGFQPSSLVTQQQQLLGLGNVSSMIGSVLDEQPLNTHDGGDDDLGFDPWNESAKGLQDLIESEAINSHAHVPHSAHNDINHLPSHHQPHLMAADRTKTLPPGFTPNHFSTFNQNPLLTGSRMMNLMKLPPTQNSTPQYDTNTELTNQQHQHHQHQGSPAALGGGGGGGQVPPLLHNNSGDAFSMKSWQEGLRALLPNINIHFGGVPSGGPGGINQQHLQQQMAAAPGMMSHLQQQNLQQQQQQQINRLQQQTQNTHNSWDLSFDPAIVTSGHVTDTNNLLEEPHWMASLHHLTEEQPTTQTNTLNLSNNNPNKYMPGLHPHSNPAATLHHPLHHQHNNLNMAAAHHGIKLHSAATAAFTQQQPAQNTPAPPPGFQNTIRPPPQLLATTAGLEAHQLIDGFQ